MKRNWIYQENIGHFNLKEMNFKQFHILDQLKYSKIDNKIYQSRNEEFMGNN